MIEGRAQVKKKPCALAGAVPGDALKALSDAKAVAARARFIARLKHLISVAPPQYQRTARELLAEAHAQAAEVRA
jgi:hypothetical protein